jgi:hypothetical protein
MKGKKRSHRSRKPSFPKKAPIGTGGGNEKRFAVIEVIRPGQPSAPVLTIDGRPVPFPFQIRQAGTKLKIRTMLPPGYLEDVEPDLLYWKSISKRMFPKTHDALQKGQTHSELMEIFALEVATISKDPCAVLDTMPTRLFKPMHKAIRKVSPWKRMDALDLLLLKNYRQKGWDSLRMAEVGKICGKLLKAKAIPATTIKDRTTELNLQTKLKPGAQTTKL